MGAEHRRVQAMRDVSQLRQGHRNLVLGLHQLRPGGVGDPAAQRRLAGVKVGR
jgi:hypothetical protein